MVKLNPKELSDKIVSLMIHARHETRVTRDLEGSRAHGPATCRPEFGPWGRSLTQSKAKDIKRIPVVIYDDGTKLVRWGNTYVPPEMLDFAKEYFPHLMN